MKRLCCLALLLLTASACGPTPAGTPVALSTVDPQQPVFELEARKSSYGLALRDPSHSPTRLGKQFQTACEERRLTFFAGSGVHVYRAGRYEMQLTDALRAWLQADPAHRLVIASSAGSTSTSDGITVGMTEHGSEGPWMRKSVAVYCQY